MYSEFKQVYDAFQSNGLEDPLHETLCLLNIVSGGALSNAVTSLFDLKRANLSHIAQKRKEGTPLEYIIGSAAFAGIRLYCSHNTLIPTECTRLLVEVALDFIEERQKSERHQTVIEVGTGCGNIAVLLAMYTSGVKLIASDINREAVDIAQRNIDKFNLNDTVSLYCGDLFSPLYGLGYEENVDLTICNPPYIPTTSLKNMAPEIVDYQPRIALDGGPYGIDFYRRLTTDSILMLKPGGVLIFEIGVGQEKLASRILSKNGGYENIGYSKDKDGKIRVISACKKRVL